MKTLIDANRLRDEVTKSWIAGEINKADMDEVFRLIDKLAKVQEWIPVNVALPDEDGEYLVVTENDRSHRRCQVSSFVRYDEIGYTWGIETSPIYTVKAWCELPEMWEG